MIIEDPAQIPDYNRNQRYNRDNLIQQQEAKLDLTSTPLVVAVENIDQYPNEVYAMLRKNGLGTSDSSVVLGVNPYTTHTELISEKCRTYLTEEEKAVGEKTAVRKGRDLEPLIIHKFSLAFGTRTIKPVDMYAHKDFPWLRFNFDGVTGTPEQYIPAEIKVVTRAGEKHYDKYKAFFQESVGFTKAPNDVSERNWSIETKAAEYGIPPYYYTQLQQQILGLNAPLGYLSVLFDNEWKLYTYLIPRDEHMINSLIIEGSKTWDIIEARRGLDWQQRAGLESI